MVERVVAGHRRVARAVCLPRSEGAGGVDLAARDGVGERRIIPPRRVGANIVQSICFSSKSFGSLSGLEVSMISRELSQTISSTTILILPRCFGNVSACLRPHFAGRDVDLETVHPHHSDMHWLDEKPGQSRVKGEVIERDQRLRLSRRRPYRRAGRCAGGPPRLRVRAGKRRSGCPTQRDCGIGRPMFRDTTLQNGAGARDGHGGGDRENQHNNECADSDPGPHVPPITSLAKEDLVAGTSLGTAVMIHPLCARRGSAPDF